MTQTIDPKTTPRAKAFELWMKSPMPMVTLTKTPDIRHLLRISKKNGSARLFPIPPRADGRHGRGEVLG